MIKLAIDLGSTMTKIYRADTNGGIVLAEPSCVVVKGADQEVKAVGKEAKNLVGKTAGETKIVYPVYEGVIVDMRLATVMLKDFLSRIGIYKGALKRAQILIGVPCGLQGAAMEGYKMLVEECDLRNVRFVETPYLVALGSGAVLSDSDPVFCLDIGGGVTNAAVVSANGIISGIAINVGGNNMDANIISKLFNEKGLLIGALTAERIKNEIGSLSVNALGTMVAEGSSTENCQPASVSVQATELTECIRVYVDKILEYAMGVLYGLPAEVAAAVNRNGVYLSGGVMKLSHVPQYISMKLGMRYHLFEESQFVSVLGGGMLLNDKDFLNRFSQKAN